MFINILHTLRSSLLYANQRVYSFLSKMENILLPPETVKGMVVLNREAFNKTIKVPYLDVTDTEVKLHVLMPHVKKYLLKMEHLRPVQMSDRTIILLNPNLLKVYTDLDTVVLKPIGINEENFLFKELELKYENWGANDILKSILPNGEDGVTGFSRIGHIIHVNLQNHVEKYKTLIGNILMDKTPNCRTVVNKTQVIANKYRNFEMELLCGENNFVVSVKENGITFEFDFSLVYWNPRLSSEHERIVNMLKPGDVLYDACAGVGPFSIPAAKRKCTVLANDLNPHCYKYLQLNAQKNKVVSKISCFNKDARDFIKNDFKNDIVSKWKANFSSNMHLTMNLPASAVEFLDTFKGLCNNESVIDTNSLNMPIVHVYCFVLKSEDSKQTAKKQAEYHLGFPLAENLIDIAFVRNVSPKKDMMRVSFKLTGDILFDKKRSSTETAPENDVKRQCVRDGQTENGKQESSPTVKERTRKW